MLELAVANTAVAQICEGLGFHAIQSSALEALADILLRYLSQTGTGAHFYANLAGRTQCNAFDVVLALEDMAPGATADRCLANSSALREVTRYVKFAEEIPFARPVPKTLVSKKRTLAPTFAQRGEQPPFAHIPAWLPAFPDPRMVNVELPKQRRKAERSLFGMSSVGGDAPFELARVMRNGTEAHSRPLEEQLQEAVKIGVEASSGALEAQPRELVRFRLKAHGGAKRKRPHERHGKAHDTETWQGS